MTQNEATRSISPKASLMAALIRMHNDSEKLCCLYFAESILKCSCPEKLKKLSLGFFTQKFVFRPGL